MRIVVLLGGDSAEREVSLVSGRAVAAALQARGHEVLAVDTAGGRALDLEAPPAIGEAPPEPPMHGHGAMVHTVGRLQSRGFGDVDLVFIALHGTGGEDGTIQGLLEASGIPYTGSGVLASSLAMDKELCKRVFRDLGIPTPAGFAVPVDADAVDLARDAGARCGFPAVVKPCAQGSSVGVSIVQAAADLGVALQRVAAYDDRAMIETYIPGRELTVAILEGKALPVVEIVPRGGLYDYRSKYTPGNSTYEVPATLPEAVARTVQELAERAFSGLRCRDFARVDFRLDPDNRPFCLEVNTIPGMTPTSLVPKAAAAAGIDFETLVERIARNALSRRTGTPQAG